MKTMIMVLAAALLFTGTAMAAGPYVVSNSYTAPAVIPDRFRITLDSGSEVVQTPWTGTAGDGSQFTNAVHFDLAGISVGSHVISAKACKGDPLWGQELCSDPGTLNFTKPTPPAAAPSSPAGLSIKQ